RAQELYVEGMHERSRRDIDATALALAKLEEAIKEDPQYAEAWAGYSRALSGAVVRQLTTPAEGLPKARAAAERALMLDPTVADAHVTLLHIHMDFDKDFAAATRDMEKARQLGLDTASFWHYSAMWHGQQGRVEEALADMRRARALEPMTLGAWQGDLGVLYVKTGRREDALREIARLATLQSQGFGESYEIATIQAALGELDPACESLARALTDKSFLVNWMRLDPRMDPLRGRKCFTDVEGKLYGDSKGTG
ncbi:MAG TPA: tetratricopeptide repeat protein, partial [Steroidobacteraceae bacterium]|nr:tetratricopeptide repeat protein [Steroidobacteraceae bacterium]